MEVGATHVALGHQHPTGGWAPTVTARMWWHTSERARASVGLGAAAFGFSSMHWLGVLAGPEVGSDYRVSGNWRVGAALAADLGRVPITTNWGYPMRYWVISPRAQTGVSYEAAPGASVSLGIAARYVTTLPWSGFSVEPAARAIFGW